MKLSWYARGAASAERMRRLMQLRGATPNGHPLWNQQEIGDLVDGYPDYRSIFPKLERRTEPATYSKAGRLGITRRKAPTWSDNEILRLRKFYPRGTRDEILGVFPGRTWTAIAKQANARGIYRAPKPLNPTGNRVLDQILARARERNVSMAELDQVVKRKRYFALRRWRSHKYDHSAHFRAVLFLGGNLRAEWIARPVFSVL